MSGAADGVMTQVGRLVVARRKAVLAVSAAVFVVATAIGAGVIDRLSSGGFDAEDSVSARALQYLEEEFGGGEVDLVLLVTAKNGDVDHPEVVAAGQTLTEQLRSEPGIGDAFSYWTAGQAPPLRSVDGDKALVLARITGDENAMVETVERVSPKYRVDDDLIQVGISGYAEVFREVSEQTEKDLQRAETIAIPLTGLLLLFVFRSAVAAGLPLLVGGLAVIGAMFILTVVAALTEVSIFALNMTTAMGLGLAIDYSLFVVSRYREELASGSEPHDAVVRTVATAGRTVAFSAVTVAASLVALLVFPLAFLRSFGFAGIAVVTFAGTASVITLPAMLAVLGRRIDKWSIRRSTPKETGTGGWHRLATAVMRRPVPVAVAGILFLLLLGLPALRMNLGMPDPRVLPESAPSRQVAEEFEANFAGSEAFPTLVVVRNLGETAARADDIDAYSASLSMVDGVARVDTVTGSYAQGARVSYNEALAARFARPDATYLSVVPAPRIPPFSPRAEELVEGVKSVPSPIGEVEVTGQTARFLDAREVLFSRLPIAILLIMAITFVVLFLAFGSLLMPVKAIALNLLSLTATFGAMVWIFQDGNLSGLLDFTPREAVDVFNPILMFAIAFGLSMDYEVFMLSRVKEEYDRTGDNEASVAMGLEKTGRLITAAALLIAVVFLAQVISEVSIIKMFGLGLALAVLVDAFVVRATLVPAFMRLAGDYNWWAPPALRRLHARIGFAEAGPGHEPAVTPLAAIATDNGSSARRAQRRPRQASNTASPGTVTATGNGPDSQRSRRERRKVSQTPTGTAAGKEDAK